MKLEQIYNRIASVEVNADEVMNIIRDNYNFDCSEKRIEYKFNDYDVVLYVNISISIETSCKPLFNSLELMLYSYSDDCEIDIINYDEIYDRLDEHISNIN